MLAEVEAEKSMQKLVECSKIILGKTLVNTSIEGQLVTENQHRFFPQI
jgi:hypothetical protein